MGMKKAAIVIDEWKLKIFDEVLQRKGYEYSTFKAPSAGLLILQVETDNLKALKPVVAEANAAAARSKMH